MPDYNPLTLSLLVLSVAVVVLYAGSRLLWASVSSAGLWRGVVMASPLVVLGVALSAWSPPSAVALMVSSAVLAMTLGLGVSTMDVPPEDAEASPLLRSPLPLVAVVCLAGFHGELSWAVALGIAVVGGLTLWSADGERVPHAVPARAWLALPAAVLLLTGLAAVAAATLLFRRASGSGAGTPVTVLLTTPAVCLALLGLLTAEAKEIRPHMPQETAVGVAIGALGLGLPVVVFASHLTRPLFNRLAGGSETIARIAATQPADAPVWMPVSTWRVDSVLLVVVSILLLPFAAGRMRLGRAEGLALVVLFLAYAAVATRTGALTG